MKMSTKDRFRKIPNPIWLCGTGRGFSGTQQTTATTTFTGLIANVSDFMSTFRLESEDDDDPALENNPIRQDFQVGKEICSAGPDLCWQIHDAVRKSDAKPCSVFVLDKRITDKLSKINKRRESILEHIKETVHMMYKMQHSRMLQIIHDLEEGTYTLAFATEPVIASLHNIFAWQSSCSIPSGGLTPVLPKPLCLGPPAVQEQYASQLFNPKNRPKHARDYEFLDIELRMGLLQIVEALEHLHYTERMVHRNVCPEVILVTKRGTWKLFGLEFVENIRGRDELELIPVPPWSVKVARLCQPNLDYTAPECQLKGECNILSDMFSLGLIICSLFNRGIPLVAVNNHPALYLKQMEFFEQQVNLMLQRIPRSLHEAVQRMLSKTPEPRPSTLQLPFNGYFKASKSDPGIKALQFLDAITFKDSSQKQTFFRGALVEALPAIPQKMRWQAVWPILESQFRMFDVLEAVLVPLMWIVNHSTPAEFEVYGLSSVRFLMRTPLSTSAAVSLLEQVHYIVRKSPDDNIQSEIMPVVYSALDSDRYPLLQTAALMAVLNCTEYLPESSVQAIVLPKSQAVLERRPTDVKVISLVLGIFEKILLRLERNHVLGDVIPTLLAMQITDPDIVIRFVKFQLSIISVTKFDLGLKVLATQLIPSLVTYTINPYLSLDQFGTLMQAIHEMLDCIDKSQKATLKVERVIPQPVVTPMPDLRTLRQKSIEITNPPPFTIPNLRVNQRKTSSAEDVIPKPVPATVAPTSTSNTGSFTGSFKNTFNQWIFGSNASNTNDSNYLRVTNVFPNRRSSDNTMLAPKIRIAPSCASSPGGTPGSAAGLPTRRHSSIGPQERRTSGVNLSPPIAGSMPNASSSGPFLLTSSMHSVRSRRASAARAHAPGSGFLQQLTSGTHQLFSGGT